MRDQSPAAKAQRKAYQEIYRKENHDKLNNQRAGYRKSIEYKQWLADTKAKRSAREAARARVRRESSIIQWLKHILCAAKSRKHECTITIDNLLEKWYKQNGLCAICNLPMNYTTNSLASVSIDRIDSNIGYINENVHLVARWVNIAKSDRPLSEMVEIIKQLTHQSSLPKPLREVSDERAQTTFGSNRVGSG